VPPQVLNFPLVPNISLRSHRATIQGYFPGWDLTPPTILLPELFSIPHLHSFDVVVVGIVMAVVVAVVDVVDVVVVVVVVVVDVDVVVLVVVATSVPVQVYPM